jgi:7-cyano-7-deazaguanine reductase
MPKYLGKSNSYVNKLDKDIELDVLRRQTSSSYEFEGFDYWNSYEFMFQNNGQSCLACIEIKVPAHSKNIVESKSLKLFLNKFYDQELQEPVISQYLSDLLSNHLDALVKVRFVHQFESAPDFIPLNYSTGLLHASTIYRFEGYRSLCPVTSQPDYANLYLASDSFEEVDSKSIMNIIHSHMNQQAFHESCVEEIANDILTLSGITDFQIFGRFLRRGGIDINPLRCFNSTSTMFQNFRDFNQ